MQNSISKENTEPSSNTAILAMRFICIAWLLAKLMGWKLWIRDRQFPLVPVTDIFNWPPLMQYALFVISLGIIVILVFKPLYKPLLIILLCCEVLSCLADQNRWQPWEYQYLFSIAACIINCNNPKRLVGCIAFIMAATYIYSGIGKFNEGYLVLVWDSIFLKKIFKLSEDAYQQNAIHYLGYTTAVAETLFAIGLFFYKTQRAAAWGMIVMHLLILYALGPLGINYNSIIWPWNILMMALLYFIFIKNPSLQVNIKSLWPGWNKIILITWGILPALNYVGLWDNYLSARLYSGGLPLMAICLKNPAVIAELEPYLSKTGAGSARICNGDAMINLQLWAMKEMNVPPYPQMRVYKQIEQIWAETYPYSDTRFIYYYLNKQKTQNK